MVIALIYRRLCGCNKGGKVASTDEQAWVKSPRLWNKIHSVGYGDTWQELDVTLPPLLQPANTLERSHLYVW